MKVIMRILFPALLIILFFMVFLDVDAQKDLKKGYIITNTNDTIHGSIEFKGDISSAKKCIFLKEGASEKVDYAPLDIIAYRIEEGKFYIAKKIKKDGVEEVLFLEYLIEGIVSVYYYRDETKDHYFIEKRGEDLLELKNEIRDAYINNVKYVAESNEYKGVLKYVFQDSPKTSQEVDNLYLGHKSMIKIAKDYHNEVCSGEQCIVFEKKKTKIKVKFGAMLGINYFTLKKSVVERATYLSSNTLKSAVYPTIGIFFKLGMPSTGEKLYFQYEINYSQRKLKTDYTYFYYAHDYDFSHQIKYTDNVKISMTLNSIKNAGIVGYEFPIGKISPVVQAGIFADYMVNSTYSQTTTNLNDSTSLTITESPYSHFDYGLIVGLGGTYAIKQKHLIGLDFRYQMGAGFDEGGNKTKRYLIGSQNFSIDLSYRF
jgi:hypothetical protein